MMATSSTSENVDKLLPDYTAVQARRQPSSYSPLWEPHTPLRVSLTSVPRIQSVISSRNILLLKVAWFTVGKLVFRWVFCLLIRIFNSQSLMKLTKLQPKNNSIYYSSRNYQYTTTQRASRQLKLSHRWKYYHRLCLLHSHAFNSAITTIRHCRHYSRVNQALSSTSPPPPPPPPVLSSLHHP
jgi:hypothetical protein